MSEDQCLAGAWGERGHADGMAGMPISRFETHAETCAGFGVSPDAKAYETARENGLREYCTPVRGFEVGRGGNSYAGVCPPQLEADFLPAYRDGQVVHQVEQVLSSARASVERHASRADALDRKIVAKQSELAADGLSEDERSRLHDRIREIRRERDGTLRDWRQARHEAEDAEHELDHVRDRLSAIYGYW